MGISVDKIQQIKASDTNKAIVPAPQERTKTSVFADKAAQNSENDKFEITGAAKNFGKGVISPVKAIIEHPLLSIGAVGATALATKLVRPLGPLLVLGFGALSLFQIGSGTTKAIKNYKKGDYKAAEKSFETIGEGTTGTVLSAFGLKASAAIAKEVKVTQKANLLTPTYYQFANARTEAKLGSSLDALKEHVSLLTTKDGLKGVAHGFKPAVVKTNAQILKADVLKAKARKYKPLTHSDEEIANKIKETYVEVFDKLKIPDNLRPKLVLDDISVGVGSYHRGTHQLSVPISLYKNVSVHEIEQTMMHEAVHCTQALLRSGLSEQARQSAVKEALLSRVVDGETGEIFCMKVGNEFKTMTPPKMPFNMRFEFAGFLEFDLARPTLPKNVRSLYDYSKSPLEQIQAIVKKYPEFSKKYPSENDAIEALKKYYDAFHFRYKWFIDDKLKDIHVKISEKDIPAIRQSLMDMPSLEDGNIIYSNFAKKNQKNIIAEAQYKYSPEELLAEQTAYRYTIEKYNDKLLQLENEGKLTPVKKLELTYIIDLDRLNFEKLNRGADWYKQYNQLQYEPKNKKLAKIVKQHGKEFDGITHEKFLKSDKVLKSIYPKYAALEAVNTIKKQDTQD